MHQMGGNVQTTLFSKVYCLLLYLVVLFTKLFTAYCLLLYLVVLFTILFTVYSLQIVVV